MDDTKGNGFGFDFDLNWNSRKLTMSEQNAERLSYVKKVLDKKKDDLHSSSINARQRRKQLRKYVKRCAKTKRGVRYEYDTVVWQNTDYIMIHDTPIFSMFQIQFIPSASTFNTSDNVDREEIFENSRQASKEFVNIVKNVYYGLGLPRFMEVRHSLKYQSTMP